MVTLNAMFEHPPRYEKYRDARGHWRWRIKARNGRILADSGEGYWNEADCDYAIRLVRSAR
jgi:uncharacterized protein YegP (UPF0339 family)